MTAATAATNRHDGILNPLHLGEGKPLQLSEEEHGNDSASPEREFGEKANFQKYGSLEFLFTKIKTTSRVCLFFQPRSICLDGMRCDTPLAHCASVSAAVLMLRYCAANTLEYGSSPGEHVLRFATVLSASEEPW